MRYRQLPERRGIAEGEGHAPGYCDAGNPLLLFLLLSPVLASCGEVPADSALDPESIPRLTVEEEVRLGVAEGEEAQVFGRVGLAAVTEGGELWLFDGLPPRIHRFSLDGTALGTVGRPGEGPGELSEVRGMLATKGGGVAVLDAGLGRLTRFDGDGSLLESSPVPEGAYGGPIGEDLEGNLYLRARDLSDPDRRLWETPFVWLRMSEDLSVVERIPAPPVDQTLGAGIVFPTIHGTVAPNLTRTLHVLGGTGEVIWASNRQYVLLQGGPDPAAADTFAVVAARPVLKTDGERRELEALIRASSTSAVSSLPPEKPILEGLSVDQNGRLWVQLAPRPRSSKTFRAFSGRSGESGMSGLRKGEYWAGSSSHRCMCG
jgi:hypothetical protein